MYDVTCLGILVADAIVNPVDVFPESGKLSPVDSLSLHIGGCAANATINFHLGFRLTEWGHLW